MLFQLFQTEQSDAEFLAGESRLVFRSRINEHRDRRVAVRRFRVSEHRLILEDVSRSFLDVDREDDFAVVVFIHHLQRFRVVVLVVLQVLNNTYYELARPESGLTLEKAFTQTHPSVSTEDYKSAVTFLKYWPQKDRPSATNIDAILRSIGQDKMLDKVTYKSKEGYFLVKFDEKQEYTPAHPIAKFGSQMYEKGLQVAVVSNNNDADDLFSDISAELRKFNKDIPALIIVDTAIHKDVRRQLARKFMSSLTLVTFIILDRVMALLLRIFLCGFVVLLV